MIIEQLPLFEQPAPTKRSLSYDETLAQIRRVVGLATIAIGLTTAWNRRNWLYHTPDIWFFTEGLTANAQLDRETFIQARQEVLAELERNAKAEETIPQKLARYRQESAQIRHDKRDEIEAIRQKREAAEVKGKQRRVQASEDCREGAT